jgi:hypothetical protein
VNANEWMRARLARPSRAGVVWHRTERTTPDVAALDVPEADWHPAGEWMRTRPDAGPIDDR